MANLDVVRQKAARGGTMVSRAQAEFAHALDLHESTVKKWRTTAKYRAVNAISDHLTDLLTWQGTFPG